MNPRHRVSAAAVELIKRFEGFRATAAQLVDGGWTIGYGHTKTARAGAAVSESDAEALLIYDLMAVQAAVNDGVFTPLTQNQYDALVAFAFNVGVDNFRSSSVLRRVNEGNMVQAACAIEMWRKADLDGERIVVDALVRRRAAEKLLFLTPAHDWVPAPSPIIRPRVDYDVGLSLPRTSTEVRVSMSGLRGEAHAAAHSDAGDQEDAAARLSAISADPGRFAESDAGIDLDMGPAKLEAEPEPVARAVAAADPASALDPPSDRAASRFIRLDEAAVPPLDIPSHIANSDTARRIVRREAPIEVEGGDLVGEDLNISGLPLLILGFAGLAVFAGSVFWGVNAKGSGGLLDPMLVASVLGLVGIGLVASAVYFLLVRIGGRDD